MPNLFTVPPGSSIADAAARHILVSLSAAARAQAVIFVPTRRAAVTMRAALQTGLQGEASLLPRIVPLADIGEGLLTILGEHAIHLLETIPPAMTDWQQRYLLTAQVAAFLKRRETRVNLDYALSLAEELMQLQEQCARAGVTLTRETLRMLASGDMASHWEQSLQFLSILAEHWPDLETELGMTTAAQRERLLLTGIAEWWRAMPPEFPVFAVGSTASQESTAQLLHTIAELPQGCVILPGLDPDISEGEWASILPGHPLFHLKHFLDRFPVAPSAVPSLIPEKPRSLWLDALAATDQIPSWSQTELGNHEAIHLIPCAHAEAEARVITLLLREALESPGKRTALITRMKDSWPASARI